MRSEKQKKRKNVKAEEKKKGSQKAAKRERQLGEGRMEGNQTSLCLGWNSLARQKRVLKKKKTTKRMEPAVRTL